MAKRSLSGKVVATGYSRASSSGEKSAGRAAPKGGTALPSVGRSTAPGGAGNAKKIVAKPAASLSGKGVASGKAAGYKTT